MRYFLCWLLMLVLALWVSGCGMMDWIFPDKAPEPPGDNGHSEEPGPDDGTAAKVRKSVLYVADTHGNYILPVSFDVPWASDEYAGLQLE